MTHVKRRGQPYKYAYVPAHAQDWRIYNADTLVEAAVADGLFETRPDHKMELAARSLHRLLAQKLGDAVYDGFCTGSENALQGWYGWRIKQAFGLCGGLSAKRKALLALLRQAAAPRRLLMTVSLIAACLLGMGITLHQAATPVDVITRMQALPGPEALIALRGLRREPAFHPFDTLIQAAIAEVHQALGTTTPVLRSMRDIDAVFVFPEKQVAFCRGWFPLEVGSPIVVEGYAGYVAAITSTRLLVRNPETETARSFDLPRQEVLDLPILRASPIVVYRRGGNAAAAVSAVAALAGIQVEGTFNTDGALVGHFQSDSFEAFLEEVAEPLGFDYRRAHPYLRVRPTEAPRLCVGFSPFFPKFFSPTLQTALTRYADYLAYATEFHLEGPLQAETFIALKPDQLPRVCADLNLRLSFDRANRVLHVYDQKQL